MGLKIPLLLNTGNNMNLMQKNDEEKPESKTKRKLLSPAAEELFKGFIEDKQEGPRK